ncbi:MAG: thioredoxin family protein [Polyangiaceae bacterium]|jgi:thioredoxin-like negative regulator of GroEL|nr:thioredoxin family protein [Polyangiaceae bacterium]
MSLTSASSLLEIGTRAELAELFASHRLVLVCFADPWVRALREALEGIAARFPSVAVALVDADSEAAVTSGLGVDATPTTVVIRDGAEIGRLVGLSSVSRLEIALESAVHAPVGAETLRGSSGAPISW